MPAVRISTASASETRRRRSSHILEPTLTVRPGNYGLQSRPIAFAPNVTPGTYTEPESEELSSAADLAAAGNVIFPPSEKPAQPPTRKRHPPGKRPSQGYVPRPPNAFMLFRADFVKQRHVPGSIETNHGSLSKIIGNCWRQIPLEEKHYWEQRAKEAKVAHKLLYPDYRFRPVHNKNKNKDGLKSVGVTSGSGSVMGRKDKPQQTREEEMRCDAVAALLLEGKKGEELAQAVRDLDLGRKERYPTMSREGTASVRGSFSDLMASPPQPFFALPSQPHYANGLLLRRPSSVPLPGDGWLAGVGAASFTPQYAPDIALPNLPFMSHSRPVSPSPVTGISFAAQQQQDRFMLGQRRPSSAQPGMFGRKSWTTQMYGGYNTMPFFHDLGITNPFAPQNQQAQQEAETAGEPDYALFNGFSFSQSAGPQPNVSVSSNEPPCGSGSSSPFATGNSIGVAPHDLPNLELSMDGVAWSSDIGSALDSAASFASSTTTVSSHESSPTPSDDAVLPDMRSINMGYGNAPTDMYSNAGQMYAPTQGINANYDMGLSPFDISMSTSGMVDPLAMQMPMGMGMAVGGDVGYGSGYAFESGLGMNGMADTVSPVLHAPKPMLASDRTPTKMVFSETQGMVESSGEYAL